MRRGSSALEITARAERLRTPIEDTVRRPAAHAERPLFAGGLAPGDLVAEADPARDGAFAFLVDHAFVTAQVGCHRAHTAHL